MLAHGTGISQSSPVTQGSLEILYHISWGTHPHWSTSFYMELKTKLMKGAEGGGEGALHLIFFTYPLHY